MKFETTGDHATSRHKPSHATSTAGPYETREQAATDAGDIYKLAGALLAVVSWLRRTSAA